MALPHADTFMALPVVQRAQLVARELLRPGGANTGKDSLIIFELDRYWPQHSYVTAVGTTPPRVNSVTLESALIEAFEYLARNGYTSRAPGQSENFVVLTADGLAFRESKDPMAAVQSEKLLAFPLHPRLAKAKEAFANGDYEGAVLKAMRAVENVVRESSGITDRLQPRALMTRAFAKDTGPLTDTAQEASEQEGVMYLFMGAIGALRNPVGHREDLHEDPVEAAAIVGFAHYLIGVVDRAADRNSNAR